jgi:16S rRNA pseudouridine516 synthase
MSKKISLKQFLMKSGKFDRSYGCVKAIREGNVTVDKKTITNPKYFFNPKSLVKINDEKIRKAPKLYFLMNKPAGYLSQKSDNEATIYDLFKKLNISEEHKKSLFAVGRLDKDTEGLMIITNDGQLSDRIMQPDRGISKRYHAVLENPINTENIRLIEKGVIIDINEGNYKTSKCKIRKVGKNEIYISITEGKKKQIRKMIETVGNNVIYLRRVSIGGLQLGSLKTGEIKQATKEDIAEKLEY